MISFKTFITEARMAPLYHGAKIRNLESILAVGLRPNTTQVNSKLLKPSMSSNIKSRNKWLAATGTMEPHEIKPENDQKLTGVHAGVSLSRSMKFSSTWPGKSESFVVFELDQAALSHRYQIIPLQYWSSSFSPARKKDSTGDRNEYEEFVVTTKPIDPRYFKRVYYKLIDSSERLKWDPEGTLSMDQAKELVDKMKAKYPHIQFTQIK